MSEEVMYRGRPVKFWAEFADYRDEVATERGKEIEFKRQQIQNAWAELLKHGSKETVESCYGDGEMEIANAIRKTIEEIKGSR